MLFNPNCLYRKINFEKFLKFIKSNKLAMADSCIIEFYDNDGVIESNTRNIIHSGNNIDGNLIAKYYQIEFHSAYLEDYFDIEGTLTFVYGIGLFEIINVDYLVKNNDYYYFKNKFLEYDKNYDINNELSFKEEGFLKIDNELDFLEMLCKLNY